MRWPGSSILNKFIPTRLWQQIFIALLVFVILPLCCMWSFMLVQSEHGIRDSVLRDYREISVRATGEVEATVRAAQQSLELAAAIVGTIHADSWKVETAIVELTLKHPIFQRVSMVLPSGIEVASSELGDARRNFAGDPALPKALKGNVFLSDVRLSDDHLPLMTIAVPVSSQGRIVGALVAELNLREIWNIVDSIQVGNSGFAFLVDHKDRIIAHPNKRMVLSNSAAIYPDLPSIHVKESESGESSGGLIVSYAKIKSLNWLLVIEQPKKEALSFLIRMQSQSMVMFIVSLLACVLASFWLTGTISRPLRGIMTATRQLSRGEYPDAFRIRRRDEVGRLLFSFNRMTVKMRTAQQMERFSIVGKAATTIAHELKNSLVLIKTFIQLLPERHQDPKFIKDFSQTIPKELDSWSMLLQNMMELSKSTPWTMTLLNVNQVIMEIVDLAKLRALQKGITLSIEPALWLPDIKGDRIKLKQAFLNLISNAIDATPAGGNINLVSRRSSIPRRSEECVEVCFQNTGPGITSSQLSRIFEPFFTTKDNGLGLGLSICQEIIKRHGGEISVTSTPKMATEFVVRFFVDRVSLAGQGSIPLSDGVYK